MLTYSITPPDHCRRLESFLRTLLPTAPSGYPRKLIKSGAVKLNGESANPDTFLAINDSLTVKESSQFKQLLTDERPVVDILYEDSQIIIVNKPGGLAMHRTAEGGGDLVEQATSYMNWRGTPCKLYPVNRLDRGTSGAVILAKSSTSAGIYGRQVKETGLTKLYLALVEGTLEVSGTIDEPLDGKESETHYSVIMRGEQCSLLAVVPISGRMHQIRRHLEMIGHPVMGDKRYGSVQLDQMPGFALHSFKTTLIRPETGRLTVCGPLSQPFIDLCRSRGIDQEQLFSSLNELAKDKETSGRA